MNKKAFWLSILVLGVKLVNDKVQEKGKELQPQSERDRFVRKLKYKGNRKQFLRNTEIDAIVQNIQAASDSELMKTLADDARAKIERRQKLIRIPDQG